MFRTARAFLLVLPGASSSSSSRTSSHTRAPPSLSSRTRFWRTPSAPGLTKRPLIRFVLAAAAFFVPPYLVTGLLLFVADAGISAAAPLWAKGRRRAAHRDAEPPPESRWAFLGVSLVSAAAFGVLLHRVAHGGELPGGVNVSPLFVVIASFARRGARARRRGPRARSRAPSRGGSAPRPEAPSGASILRGVNAAADTVVVLDFGSQYTQVIARRIREARVRSVVLPFDAKASEVAKLAPKGIILSGGPSSVYDADAPQGDAGLFDLKVPVLGLCYGMMWLAQRYGGRVGSAPGREYGRAHVNVSGGRLFRGLGPVETIWMSHGDHVESAPAGFSVTATTANAPVAAFEDAARALSTASRATPRSTTPSTAPRCSRISSTTSAARNPRGRWRASATRRSRACARS